MTERTADVFAAPPSRIAAFARRWWVIAVVVGLCVLGGFVYLTIAKPHYTAHAVLAMDQPVDSAGKAIPPDEYLNSQREQILSTPVLSAAGSDVAAIENSLRVRSDKGQGTITLSFDAESGSSAALRLGSILDAYRKASQQRESAVQEGWKELSAKRDHLAADRAAKEKALLEFKDRAKIVGGDIDKAAADRLDQLQKALTSAQVEAASAKAAAGAADSLLNDPVRLREVVDANRSSGVFTLLDQQKNQIQAEIATLEPQLQKQKETLLPQHPALVQTQKKIDAAKQKLGALATQYAEVYRTFVQRQDLTAQKKVQELQSLVDAAAKDAQSHVTNLNKHKELEAQLRSVDDALTEAQRRLADATASGGGSGMRVVQPPKAPDRPSSPQATRVMGFAAAVGLVIGAALALITGRAG